MQLAPGIAAGLAATALLSAGGDATAKSEQLNYTPEACSTDAKGKVYLRIGSGIAFGFPADALVYLRDPVRYDPPPAPNPDDQEGCPGNPFDTSAAYLRFSFPAPVVAKTGEFTPEIPLVFSIIGAVAALLDADGYLHTQKGTMRLLGVSKESGNWCETTPAGWEVCYGTIHVNAEPAKRGGALYVASAEVHPLRSGGPITMWCTPQLLGTDIRQCSTSYQSLPGVSLAFRFNDNVIPVESFFDLDRAITEWLEAARVPELDFVPPEGILYRQGKGN